MGTADGTILGTTKIVDNGPATQRWNLLIFSEGYRSTEMAQFATDAQQFANTLFATPPFDRLRTAINIYRVDVTSTDSGAKDPAACGGTGANPRTYFDASFCTNGIRRLLVVNNATVISTASAQVPQWHMAIVAVNSTVYGGSGGAVATFSKAAGALEIAMHEMGHTAFGFADEYEYYAGCGVDTDRAHHPASEPSEPNVTTNNNRATIKWRNLIQAATPMPTTANANCANCDPQASPVPAATVGAFEGAHYYHCGCYRPQFNCRMRALNNPFCAVCQQVIVNKLTPFVPVANPFTAVYHQGDPGNGIGGYDLKSPADRAFAFDYDHSSKLDYLALYRPHTGTIWILKNSGGAFSPVYHQGDPGNGIGGYDLKSSADQAFAFDYDHSGKQDHIALFRPGTGTMWILKNSGGVFSAVYHQGDPGNGIGGYDLKSKADQAFAFDYGHSGKLDHIALYRPGTGTIWILKNSGGVFSPVYHQGDPGNGIGGYDLKSPADRAFAFDYDHSGKLDYLALYRPRTGTIWILKNSGGNFSPVYHQGDPGNGIGGYDLKSAADRAFAFDYDHSGKQDHLALYRPGTGTIWILKNNNGAFSPVYNQGDPGNGIGGYDLKSAADRAFAFDYGHTAKLDHLALYRPGTGTIWILKRT